jgi:hypothetical protein
MSSIIKPFQVGKSGRQKAIIKQDRRSSNRPIIQAPQQNAHSTAAQPVTGAPEQRQSSCSPDPPSDSPGLYLNPIILASLAEYSNCNRVIVGILSLANLHF